MSDLRSAATFLPGLNQADSFAGFSRRECVAVQQIEPIPGHSQCPGYHLGPRRGVQVMNPKLKAVTIVSAAGREYNPLEVRRTILNPSGDSSVPDFRRLRGNMPFASMKDWYARGVRRLNRRELFRNGGFWSLGGLFGGTGSRAVAASSAGAIPTYESLGVRPLINPVGVMTIIGGSLMLPEVKLAMEEASRHFVHLDELAEGVGKRLAELTGAEWGIVTSGCAAAMTHATSACIAGADPEKLQRLPDLTGMKNEVIVPTYCRNVYDHAVRMLGVKMVEAENLEQYQAAFNPRTAMVYLFNPTRGEFGLEAIAGAARQRGVPVLVDAAAQGLTIPNVYLQAGATLVAYSGGKRLRGPQCTGLLLGQKDLVRAAWLNSAPHHSFGRPMKVGKEEMMGMLAAVEAWVKRDADAERRQWQSCCEYIAAQVSKAPGVKAEIPNTLGDPYLRIAWEAAQLGITAAQLEKALFEGNPRLARRTEIPWGPRRPANRAELGTAQSISINAFGLSAGEEKIVAERIYSLLSKPPRIDRRPAAEGPTANVAGQWTAHLEFICGSSDHSFEFEQEGNNLRGTHRGQFLSGDLGGYVDGNRIVFRTSHKYEGFYLNYEFSGQVEGNTMRGTVDDMSTITTGEYGEARWTARRHAYTEPRGDYLSPPGKRSRG